jgi:hypothetical protein
MKRILILLLFVGLGQQLKAQEEFLKLDSVVVLEEKLTVSSTQYAGTYYTALEYNMLDSLINPVNGIIKIKNIHLSVQSTASPTLGESNYYEVQKFNCKLNGMVITSINEHNHNPLNYLSDKYVFSSRQELDILITQNSELSFQAKGQVRNTYVNSPMEFRYRIELVYYSYEN